MALMDISCPAPVECVDLTFDQYVEMASAVADVGGSSQELEDDFQDVKTCNDVYAAVNSAWSDAIWRFEEGSRPPDGWGWVGFTGIAFHHDFLQEATHADLVWMLIHEARHNAGQDHVGSDFDPDDSDVGFAACALLPSI